MVYLIYINKSKSFPQIVRLTKSVFENNKANYVCNPDWNVYNFKEKNEDVLLSLYANIKTLLEYFLLNFIHV